MNLVTDTYLFMIVKNTPDMANTSENSLDGITTNILELQRVTYKGRQPPEAFDFNGWEVTIETPNKKSKKTNLALSK